MAWGVARTHGGEEARARENLERQGYNVRLPRYRETVVRRGRRVVELVPLFPRYIFVDVSQGFRSIFGTRGVAELFMWGEKPALVRDAEMQAIMAGADAEDVVALPADPLVGKKVLVRSGVCADMVGLCEGMSGAQRVRVLLKMLGRDVRVTLDRHCVAAA
jgi:transcriptional antiterminator RfaH